MVYLFRGKKKRLLIVGVVCTLYLWSLISPSRWFTHVRYSLHLPGDEKHDIDGLLARQLIEHRSWLSENRSQLSENRSQLSDNKSQLSENRSQYHQTQVTPTSLHSDATSFNDPRTGSSRVSDDASLSLVYENKWVGFPEIAGYNCSEALFSTTQNDRFPKAVARIKNRRFFIDSQNCSDFRKQYGFMRYPQVSEEERAFPIAFIILFHSNLDQVMFLLRAIYRPHNVYCLSVDVNSGDELIQAVRSVAGCLPNVFVAGKLESVVYAGFTRLLADIDCMQDLLERPEPWKYTINMPGQQFPLRTNLELVRILKLLNGSNNIDVSEEVWSSVKNRHLYKHIYLANNVTGKLEPVRTSERNPRPPHGMNIKKGSTYAAFSRAFVQFAVHHPVAQDFLEWNKNVLSPDEYFWTTLQYTGAVSVPGGVFDKPSRVPYITSLSMWKVGNWTCATRFVRKICILSPEDLSTVVKQNSLFVNKLHINHHPGALHCLDEWLVNRTFAGSVLDLSLYKSVSDIKVQASGDTSRRTQVDGLDQDSYF
ncbi:hypothetical protein BsWGS_01446 [Bradybaena similaris]